MRIGHKNQFLFNNNTFLGIGLGADYCAEHEVGITGLKREFGLPEDEQVFGLQRRLITRRPDRLIFTSVNVPAKPPKKFQGLFMPSWRGQVPEASSYTGENGLYTAWDEKSFCAFCCEEKGQIHLKELDIAFTAKNVVMWLGGGGVFLNAGLAFAIADRMRKEHLDLWDKTDRERYQLKEDAKKTGIEQLLKEAGRTWFALSPRRKEDGSIIFWLNPCEQKANNSGWFTVSELKQWIDGKGPIPKYK